MIKEDVALLAQLMNFDEAQQDVLEICFWVADDQGLPILDFNDLRTMLGYIADHAAEIEARYGGVSKTTIGTIQRALRRAESEGMPYPEKLIAAAKARAPGVDNHDVKALLLQRLQQQQQQQQQHWVDKLAALLKGTATVIGLFITLVIGLSIYANWPDTERLQRYHQCKMQRDDVDYLIHCMGAGGYTFEMKNCNLRLASVEEDIINKCFVVKHWWSGWVDGSWVAEINK
jgi:hypothetical protein